MFNLNTTIKTTTAPYSVTATIQIGYTYQTFWSHRGVFVTRTRCPLSYVIVYGFVTRTRRTQKTSIIGNELINLRFTIITVSIYKPHFMNSSGTHTVTIWNAREFNNVSCLQRLLRHKSRVSTLYFIQMDTNRTLQSCWLFGNIALVFIMNNYCYFKYPIVYT